MYAASQLGLDPFTLFHMGRDEGYDEDGKSIGPVNDHGEPLAGVPKYPRRYKRFLMACAAVAFEYHAKASGTQVAGTTSGSHPSRRKG
jgi:hypothetical protein